MFEQARAQGADQREAAQQWRQRQSSRGTKINRWSRGDFTLAVLVGAWVAERPGGVDAQELEHAAHHAGAVAAQVVEEHHVDPVAAEDLEVALELLGEAHAVAVEEVLDVDRPCRQASPGPAVGLGRQRLREVGDRPPSR